MIYVRYLPVNSGEKDSLHTAARRLLHELLYAAFGVTDAENAIKAAKGGKPYIKGADFDFSDSHTEGAVAVAVCGAGEKRDGMLCFDVNCEKIGVDIECALRDISTASVKRIVKRCFTDKERDYVYVNAEGVKERFLRLWTQKESIAKATGEGLAGISRADTSGEAVRFIKTVHVNIGDKEYILSVAGI